MPNPAQPHPPTPAPPTPAPPTLGTPARTWLLLALGAAVLALVAAGLAAQPPGSHGQLNQTETLHYVACALAAALPFAAAVHLVRTRPVAPWALYGIAAIAIAARLLVLAAPPLLSTDIYRYVWDGRVQAAGINPYLYIPADPALAPLRDPGQGPSDIFANINRADFAPTIYPPAAQALFALVGLTASSIWTMKAVMMAFDLLTAAILLVLLRTARLPLALVVVWAWHPLVIWEFANEGHIDAASIAFTAAALLAAARLRPAWAGAALATAVLLKLLPLPLFAALWRRPHWRSPPGRRPGWLSLDWRNLDWRMPAVATLLILAAYGAYSHAGLRVFGYLPGYAVEEGAKGYYLSQLLELLGLPTLPRTAYATAAVLALAAACLLVVRRPHPTDPARRVRAMATGILILSAVLLAVVSPHYPWYMAMLVMPAVLLPGWAALWPTLAAPLLYFGLDLLVVLPAIPLLMTDLLTARRTPPTPNTSTPDTPPQGAPPCPP